MGSTIVMIGLFGAVALLLFGLAQVKDGMSRAFGARLRVGLAHGTGNGLRSFVSGLAATLALQSSTATTLMTASFVEQGLIRPRMAQTVLLGANVGTAVTAWVVATGIEWLSPLLILIGFVFYRSGLASRQGGGTAVIGVGLMLLSLHLLSVSTEPFRQSSALAAFIALLDNAWPVAFALSAGLAFISSSSLAAIVLILSLAATGILSSGLIVAFVLGANLGGAIPPVIATLGGAAAARRLTLGNLIVRAAGCAIALPLTGFAVQLVDFAPFSPDKLPVDIHLAFNIGVAALAWPFSRLLSRVMLRMVPDVIPEDVPRYLDEDKLSIPVVALANATREVLGVGDLIERMLLSTSQALEKNDLTKAEMISSLETRVDRLQQDVKVYLSKLGREDLIEDHRRRSIAILDYAINLEHIGDIIEKGLLQDK
jgi:phosphate:Na+ symporter